ncbi:MAG: FAD-binding oxidoreductase [Phycisphaerales bacterium]|nr:FAD-binding oxidoreductase [Phycisphaerales bacterium]
MIASAAPLVAWQQVCNTHQLTDAILQAFNNELTGDLVLPTDALYDWARLTHHTNFDGVYPVGIVFCETPQDVSRAILFAREYGLHVVSRCGGHSYEGYSVTGGLVLDLSRMNQVSVNPAAMTAVVGSGCVLIDVYHALYYPHKLSVPGGSCPSVGISGYLLGGGVGLQSRTYGVGCDVVLEIGVVLASGEYVVASPTNHPDLYWAYRGGGGGNFGVVTHFKLKCHPVDRLSYGIVTWEWSAAAEAFDAWQNWLKGPGVDYRNFSIFKFLVNATGDGGLDPKVNLIVQFDSQSNTGTGEIEALMAPLLNTAHDKIISQTIMNDDFFDVTMEVMAGCAWPKTDSDTEFLRCHTVGNPAFPMASLPRETYKAKSTFFGDVLSQEGIQVCIDAIDQRFTSGLPTNSSKFTCALQFDSEGGIMGDVPKDATAFMHRDCLMHCQYLAYWPVEGDSWFDDNSTFTYCDVSNGSMEWISEAFENLWPKGNGHAYQNYIDKEQPNWLYAYYGENVPRLRKVKAMYDPENFWRFAQSIPPA